MTALPPIRLPRSTRRLRRLLAAAALATVAQQALAQAQPGALDELRRLVEGSQFEAAWQAAQARPQLLGDVHFDFLYGVAAVSTGRIAEGLLALERHLAAVPGNDRARLELARGYFLLGEYGRARAEFEFVLRANPPAGVRANIQGFLQAMQVRETADRRTSARFYAEVGAGRDNNVNGGTWRAEVPLAFGTIPITGSPSAQVSDNQAQVTLGGQQQLRVSARTSVFAGAELDHRANQDAQEYNLTSGGVNLGFTQLAAGAQWRTTLAANALAVGGNRYRDVLQATLETTLPLGTELSLLGFAQYAEQRHVQEQQALDSRATTLGGMLTWTPDGVAWQPQLGVRLSYTQDDNLRLRKDLSKQMPLLRLFAAVSPTPRVRVSFGVVAYRQDFQGTDIAFQNTRQDDALSADGQLTVALSPSVSVRAEGGWSRTRSNQALYDSNRKFAALKLRYQY